MKNNRADIHYRIAHFEQKRSNRGGIYYRMARFEQYNLHPGRNRHYQSGRQRDPWHIRERMVMVPVPTNHVDIDVQFDISSSPYGTASYRQLITNSKLINITRDDSGLPF